MCAKSYSVAASESLLPVTSNAFWHWTNLVGSPATIPSSGHFQWHTQHRTFTTASAAERHSAFSDRRASPQTISTSYGGDKWTFFARSVCYYPHCSGSQCHGYINTAKTRPSLSDEQLPSESDSYVWTFPQSSAAYYHPR